MYVCEGRQDLQTSLERRREEERRGKVEKKEGRREEEWEENLVEWFKEGPLVWLSGLAPGELLPIPMTKRQQEVGREASRRGERELEEGE